MYVGQVRTARGDKRLDANCCLYVGVQPLIPPGLVTRSTITTVPTSGVVDAESHGVSELRRPQCEGGQAIEAQGHSAAIGYAC
jgi:hypothetical protein